MQLSYSTLLLAALSLECALAQPAHHRRAHRHKRDVGAREVGDIVTATIDGKIVQWVNEYGGPGGQPTPTPAAETPTTTATTTAATTPSSTPTHSSSPTPDKPESESHPSSSSSSQGSSSSPQLKFGGISSPKDNGNKDEYIGNVGIPYGSNMLKLENVEDAKNFKYSNTFNNPTGDKISVIVWNKSGKDGQPQSGMSLPPNLKFDIPAGQSVAVAFDENSQVAFAQDCERDPQKGNLPNCTWGEVDFGDIRNGGWSGYDRSSIPNSAGNTGLLTIACEGAKTSSKEENSFTSAAQTNAGGSLVPGPAHFHTTMGA